MIRHRDSMAASDHFSFSQPQQRSQEHQDRTHTIDYGGWTRPPRSPVNPVGEEEFKWRLARRSRDNSDDSGSGTPSPPLWKNNSPSRTQPRPTMSRSSESCPARDEVSTYLTSRAQAIAEYRREMLDLVRGLPESSYELSLRDIVETSPPKPEEAMEELPLRKKEIKKEEDKKKNVMSTTSGSSNRRIARSASLDTGLLIKIFLPLSVGGKRKSFSKDKEKEKEEKKLLRIKEGKKKEMEKKKQTVVMMEENEEEEEWWEKNDFSDHTAGSSSGISSRTSSTGSNSNDNTISSSRIRKKGGCYAFFRTK